MAKDFGNSIKTAYFYVFSAIGIILLVVGIFKLSDFAVRNYLLDCYIKEPTSFLSLEI